MRAAVDAANSGDVVLLAPGIHEGGVFVDGKSVTLASWFLTTADTAYIRQTVINGVGLDMCRDRPGCVGGAVVEFGASAHGSALVGLTVTNGNDGVASASMVEISSCRIIGNGDGVDFSSGSGGTFSNSLFADNRDDGIDLNGRVNVRILNNTIRDNRDDGVEFRLHVYSGPMLTTEIVGNRITGNGEDGIQLIDYPDVSKRVIRIERNLFSRSGDAGVGCMADGKTVENLSGAPIPERVYLINNTFTQEHYGFVGGANVIALDNLFVGTQRSALRRVAGNSIASYNLFWNNGTDYEQSNVDLARTWKVDPRLDADDALTPGSPAIDAGTAFFQWNGETVLDLPPAAYKGSAPDLGAFEYIPLSIECGGSSSIEGPATPSFPPPNVGGACDPNPSLTSSDVVTPGTCPQEYSVTRTWTAADACGRSASCSQTITVEDNTPPVFSGVGGPQTIQCPASLQFSEPIASDACDPNPSLTSNDVVTPGTCPQAYSVTRTWIATDACGNASSASQTITLEDTTAPAISGVGEPQTIQCPATPQFSEPTASDACDPSPSLTSSDVVTPGTCPQESSVTRTWTATDACGNSSQASQTITVTGGPANQPPVAALTLTPSTGNEPLVVAADASSSSDLDGTLVTYQFDFGDGTVVGPQTSATAEHLYSAGRWTASVTVTDDDGAVHSAAVPIEVAAAPPQPNLVGNPSFEQNTAGWRSYGEATLLCVQGGFDGDYALQITGTSTSTSKFGVNDSPDWLLRVPAAGTRYRFTAWVRSADSRGTSRLVVREYLNGVRVGAVYPAGVPLSPLWQILTVDYVATSEGSSLDFQVLDYPLTAGEVFLADNISIQDVTGAITTGTELAPPTSEPGDPAPLRGTIHPSPFQSRGTLSFTTSLSGMLRVDILDLAGRRVRQLLSTPDAAAGIHRLEIASMDDNGGHLSPGMYFYRIDAREGMTTGRFVVIR